jgi:hypothetical protein
MASADGTLIVSEITGWLGFQGVLQMRLFCLGAAANERAKRGTGHD